MIMSIYFGKKDTLWEMHMVGHSMQTAIAFVLILVFWKWKTKISSGSNFVFFVFEKSGHVEISIFRILKNRRWNR